jgi:flagellar protein FliO/FliZ
MNRITSSQVQKSLCGILLLSGPLVGWGAEVATRPSGTAALLQTLAGLGVVIALILALAWVSRRLSGGRLGNTQFMKILAVQPLGAREKIILVDVAGRQMMLGVTPGRIATLHVFDEPVLSVPDVAERRGGNLAARSSTEFSRKLQEFLTQGSKS